MAMIGQQQLDFDQNIYYQLYPHLLRGKRIPNLIGVYGLTSSGKKTFCAKLRDALSNDGWYTSTYTSDLFFKYTKQDRINMIESSRNGSDPDPDVLKEAFSIRGQELDEDLARLSKGDSVFREGMYKRLTGELYATFSIDMPCRQSTVIIMEGMWLSGFRKHFNAMVRVEAPYEVRRERHKQRVAKSLTPVTSVSIENLDRMLEADIFKNWNLKDIVVRSDEGFQLG